jgi:tRNA (guanine10-N2)-dimethyltransferase
MKIGKKLNEHDLKISKMNYLFVLSGEAIPLGQAEAELFFYRKAVLKTKKFMVIDLQASQEKYFSRLAYTKKVMRILFSENKGAFKKRFNEFNWQKVYKKDFRITSSDFQEADLASVIWDQVNKPKVNLTDPETDINIIKLRGKYHCCLKVFENNEKFHLRKAHMRPALHPVSLHPKLARAMVNMLGKNAKKVYDPFCGTGGILIEASLIGLASVGYDIDGILLEKCKKNLKHYRIKNSALKLKDALELETSARYICTDLPYGLNTKGKNFSTLYKHFLNRLKKINPERVVLALPDNIRLPIKPLFKGKYYIHKSLSKVIMVF